MVPKKRIDKSKIFENIKNKINECNSFLLFDYKYTKSNDVQDCRKEIYIKNKDNVILKIYKNTIFKKAYKLQNEGEFILSQQVAVLFSFEEGFKYFNHYKKLKKLNSKIKPYAIFYNGELFTNNYLSYLLKIESKTDVYINLIKILQNKLIVFIKALQLVSKKS